MKCIDFAIDLGTTNSLIAERIDGNIRVYKNPKGFKEALPSVVAFRKNTVLIGDKAKELKDRDPKNVFSVFKRKMGTDEHFFVDDLQKELTPIDLSTYVLNELRTFIGEKQPKSVVITIPASFDTIQSNATKKAGFNAGFEEVVLLQEPIAACLAVFNQLDQKPLGKWLVYDLGGGTFDVAIVEITEDSMKIIDHEGNNFLGGIDIDSLIVQNVLIPQLANTEGLTNLANSLKTNPESAENQGVFNRLLFYAEQMKIELSSYKESFVDAYIPNELNEQVEIELNLTRTQLDTLMEKPIDLTIDLIQLLLKKNHLQTTDFNDIILVGGSTYSPFVRQQIESKLGLKPNVNTDPTTAIVIGAANYASNKISSLKEDFANDVVADKTKITLSPIYEKSTRETNELVLFSVKDDLIGKFIRIIRSDNGFDSGLVKLDSKTRIIVDLKSSSENYFNGELYDENGKSLEPNACSFSISQGQYKIDGQPLPHDISIELDDLEYNETKLECIFQKNSILPLSKTIYRTVSKNLLISNKEDELIITLLEGNQGASPSSNQRIGTISIKPSEIDKNIIKNMEIAINVSISESRDIAISAHISSLDFEIEDIFSPHSKSVSVTRLKEDLTFLLYKARKNQTEAVQFEQFERAADFLKIVSDIEDALTQLNDGMSTSDSKYHIEERKRQISVRYDELTLNKRLIDAVEKYQSEKLYFTLLQLEPDMPENINSSFDKLMLTEATILQSNNISLINDLKDKINQLQWDYRKKSKKHLLGIYSQLKMIYEMEGYTDMRKAQSIIKTNENTIYRDNVSSLEIEVALNALFQLLKPEYLENRNNNEGYNLTGTGLI